MLISTASNIQNTSSLSISAMRLWSLLPIAFALQNVADAADIAKLSARSGTPATSILTPDFVEVVQQIVDAEKIPGLTLAVVYKDGSSELDAWGIKSEDGTNMTTDVRHIFGPPRGTDRNAICLVDAVQYCFLFKGLPLDFSGDSD